MQIKKILISLLIILGIGFLLYDRYHYHTQDNVRINQAREHIALLEAAVKNYKADFGEYPPEYLMPLILIQPNIKLMNTSKYPDDGYIKRYLTDPWGREFQYRYPGKLNKNGRPDIYSHGPQQSIPFDSKSFIGNWQ